MTSPDLPPADHAARQERLRAELDACGVTSLVVTTPANVRYLTGFSGSNGQVLITPAATLLITDERYDERARAEAPTAALILDRDWRGQVAGHLADAGAERVGFESAHLTYGDAHELISDLGGLHIEAVALEGAVERLRMVKDDAELAALAAACELTDAAFDAILDAIHPGRTEVELARLLERTMEDLGAEGPAFPSIVAAGSNSAIPHHRPTSRALERGELLKLDFGARVAGYHADMTRTVSLGEPSDAELVAVHTLVREAQERGVATVTAEHTAGEVDAACREPITEAGYGERFVHGTGHGVGLDIHEAPWVSDGASGRLSAGSVVTVEPGVYLPGRGGIRIEDTVAVAPDGSPRRLTTSPRDLLRL